MMLLIVFSVCLVLDFLWVKSVNSVQKRQAALAAGYAAMLCLAGQGTTLVCINEPWLLIPACAGCACGTFLATTFGDRSDGPQSRIVGQQSGSVGTGGE